MKIPTMILAGAFALPLVSKATFAQQALNGTVTQIDRINGTVAIRQTQDGTTGANSGGSEEFKAPRGFSLDTLHAGDRVSYSVTETGGVKSLTKLEKQ